MADGEGQGNQMLQKKRIIDDDDEEIQSIISLMTKEKEKKVKVKTPREEYLVSTGRRRVVKKPSVVAETASDLIRLNYKTPFEISNYFNSKGRIVDDQQKRLYYLLVKSKVSLGKFVLSDDLANSPVQAWLLWDNVKTKIISNDWLWLGLIYNRKITEESQNFGFFVQKNDLKKLFLRSDIKNVQIVSDSFRCKNDVEKGYYQDFYTNFACIGLDKLEKNKIREIVNDDNNRYGFRCNGYDFYANGSAGSCVIYLDDEKITKDVILKRIEGCRVISVNERKPRVKEKVIEIKNEVVKYVDCNVKPENFCPAFFRTENDVKYSFLFNISMNYNDMFDYLDEAYENDQEKRLMFYGDSWYWTNTESWFDFLYVYIITTKINLRDEVKAAVIKVCDFYYKYSEMILSWKKNQLFLQKICQEFVTSFSSKINYDKAKSLLGKVREYIGFRNWLMKDKSYKEILGWINKLLFCNMIQNQFRDDVMLIADSMSECLSKLIDDRGGNDEDDNKLVKEFKAVAELIYYCCPTENGSSAFHTAFPFLFSPGGFLGYMFSNVEATDVLADNLKKVSNRAENIAKKNDEAMDRFKDVFMNSDNIKKAIIKHNINELGKKEDVVFSNEELNAMTDKTLKDIMENQAFSKEFNERFFDVVKRNGNVNEMAIQNEDFIEAVKKQANEKKRNISQINADNANMRNTINNLENKINENNQIIQSSVAGSSVQSGEEKKRVPLSQIKEYLGSGQSQPEESSVLSDDITMVSKSDAPTITSEELSDYDIKITSDSKSNWSVFESLSNKSKNRKDPFLSAYYSTLVWLSGLYDKFTKPELGFKISPIDLKKMYKLRPSLFDVISRDYNISISDYKSVKDIKLPKNKIPGRNYSDVEYVKGRLNDHLGV